MKEDSDFRVGQRVCIINAGKGPQTGTVQYVGPVHGYEGAWIGVEWDNAEHGRHDGSVNGVRYFETKNGVSGSLVRPRNLSAGVSLLEALSFRYKTDTAPESDQGATVILHLILLFSCWFHTA